MNIKIAVWAAILAVVPCWGAVNSAAQDTTPQGEGQSKQLATPVKPYHLEFSLNEMQEGKKINTRHYSIDLNEGYFHDGIKIGTRVPVAVNSGMGPGNTQFQYMDVGTNITPRVEERPNGLLLEVTADISNLAFPEEDSHTTIHQPIIRQLSFHGSTVAPLGKTIVIGSMDDPNSNHQFQLEVTVTKLTP